MKRLRNARGNDADAGFGLIETVVALLIAGVVFGALATTLMSAVQASLYGRQNQQATDFMTRQLEHLRSMDFGSLAHTAADIAGDPRLVPCVSGTCLDVDGVPEPVLVTTGGGVAPHTVVLNGVETNATDFTVTSYITEASGQPVDQAVRATVYITWENRGQVKQRSTSSIIAFTQRGLPLPVFRLELPTPAVTVNPGGDIVYPLTLTNQGAPDRWNITAVGGSGWTFYEDSDGSGDLDTSLDAPMSDTTLDGIVDTDRIDPATAFHFFALRTTTPSEPIGTTTTTFTATSVGQPAASGAQKSVAATTTVTTGVIGPTPGPTPTGPALPPEVTCAAASVGTVAGVQGGYSVREFTLHNGGVGDTATLPQLYWSTGGGYETSLWHYSTDVDAALTGRILAPAGATLPSTTAALALTDPTTYADWAQQQGAKTRFDGTGVVRLWVEGASPVQMRVILYSGSSSSPMVRTALQEVDLTVDTACAGFQEVYVTLPDVDRHEISQYDWLGVRVVTGGADIVRLGYDVPSQFPAALTIGVK